MDTKKQISLSEMFDEFGKKWLFHSTEQKLIVDWNGIQRHWSIQVSIHKYSASMIEFETVELLGLKPLTKTDWTLNNSVMPSHNPFLWTSTSVSDISQ